MRPLEVNITGKFVKTFFIVQRQLISFFFRSSSLPIGLQVLEVHQVFLLHLRIERLITLNYVQQLYRIERKENR